MVPDMSVLKLGYVALSDCAPLVVAREHGFFERHGLTVTLSRESSWASIRDKVAVGALDGAQMLATMPLSMTLGLGPLRTPMVTALALSLGGNTITVANGLYARMAETGLTGAAALKAVIDADREAGRDPMTFAMVYPTSTHQYELGAWMAAGGIDPGRDARLIVVPPQQMVTYLVAGRIAGYCVGEPWGSMAVTLGLGRVVATSEEVWAGRIEKVFGVTEAWAEAHPATHVAAVRALVEACRFADEPANRPDVARLIARRGRVNAPLEAIEAGLCGRFRRGREETVGSDPAMPVFHRHAANFPWRSQAMWYLAQMVRWGHAAGFDPATVAAQVYRTDIHREAAISLGVPVPLIDVKTEGTHAEPWVLDEATQPIAMGADLFGDGTVFDPFGSIPCSGEPSPAACHA